MATLVAKSVLPPLRALRTLAAEIESGNLDTRAEHHHADEFLPVFAEFDAMREKLKDTLIKTAAIEENRRVMIAGLAHDIKTPITAICAYAEALRDGIADTPETRLHYAETILQKARLVDSLVGDLFFSSKLDLRQTSLELEIVEASAFLKEVFANTAKSEAIPLTFESAATGRIRINRIAFARVIQNIIQNSIHHARADDLHVKATAREQEARVIVKVTDNGTGLPKEKCERVFDWFYRADPARGGTGSGLGLSICKRLIEGMNGKIWARGENGFSVYISLPLCEAGDKA
jgi:signal transduction histidine kinase